MVGPTAFGDDETLKLLRRFGGISIVGRESTIGQSHMPGGMKMMILEIHIIACMPMQMGSGMNGYAYPTS